ncbi:CLOCK-interacting pacemaker [Pseudophryne corroboree]|uniref:CLOCK-interacting pacemaker n=1 Tax=Pseudophryne corroboree TaxID=495146 RepID=UPI003081DEF1
MATQGRQQATAFRGSAQRSQPRNTHTTAESDKDSGYSDVASECLSSVEQTDTEECPLTSRWITGDNAPGCPQPCSAPVLVLKNLLVDQKFDPDPHIRSWNVPSFQLFPSSSQVLVFPQSVPSAKPSLTCRKSTKYLPILNSYTKIAPHPSTLPTASTFPYGNKRRADKSRHNQAKRLLSETQSSDNKKKMPLAGHEMKEQEGQVLGVVAACAEPQLDPLQNYTGPSEHLSTDVGDPKMSFLDDIPHSSDLSVPPPENRSRRFQNTLEVLHRSGLFSIAMKTKELARLNQATQIQLERLQEQVALYNKAMSGNNPEDWQSLQESLAGCNVPLKTIDV